MNIQRSWLMVLGSAGVISLLCLVFLTIRPQATSAQKICPIDPDIVAMLPEAERLLCEENLAALKDNVDADELARIEAEPRIILPPATLSPEYIIEHGTPVSQGVVPNSEMFIKEIPLSDRVDGPPTLRPNNAESVWRVGAIIDSRSNLYRPMYVYTGHQLCGIGIDTAAVSKEFPIAFYECPNAKDARLVITDVDLKTYIVSFIDQDNRTGNFDLLNHVWNFS